MTRQRRRVVLKTMGRAMADLGARVNVWRRQGESIARDLKRLMAHTHAMLADLGADGLVPRRAVARVRVPLRPHSGSRRSRR